MNRILAILLLILLPLGSQAQTHVVVNLSAVMGASGSTTTNRVVHVQELSVPGVMGNSVRMGPIVTYVTDTNSNFTVSNCAVSVYGVTVLAPPDREYFEFYVSATNLGTIFAGTNTSVSGAPTYPPGGVAWTVAAADARYSRSTNTLGSAAFQGASTFQPASVNLSNWAAAPTNIYELASMIGTIASRSSNDFYLASNPSGYVTASITNGLATTNYAGFQPSAANLTLWAAIAPGSIASNSALGTIASRSSNDFYLASNPNSYVTASVTNGLATTNYAGFQPSSANLSNWSAAPTNLYALTSSLGTAAAASSNQFYPASNPSNFVTAASGTFQPASANLSNWSGITTSSVPLKTDLGTIANRSSNDFYLASNPNGYVTAAVTNTLATTNYAGFQTSSANLSNWSQAPTNLYVLASSIGTAAAASSNQFYPASNPSNFVTSVGGGFQTSSANLSNWSAAPTNLYQLAAGIGSIASRSSNDFYLANNPNGYVTTSVTNNSVNINDSRAVTLTNTGSIMHGTFTGDGSGLTNLDISAIVNINTNVLITTNDTRPVSLLNTTNQFGGSGSALTNLSTAHLAGQILPVNATNYALLATNATQTFTGPVNFGTNDLAANSFTIFSFGADPNSIFFGTPFTLQYFTNAANGQVAFEAGGQLMEILGIYDGDGSNLVNLSAGFVIGNHTLADGVLSTNVLLRNTGGGISGSNTFSAPQGLTNVLNTISGNGAGLTALPSFAVTNNNAAAVALTNTLNTISGNGAGLTNIPTSAIAGLSTNVVAALGGKGTNLTFAGTNTQAGLELFPEFVNTTLAAGNNSAISLGTNQFVKFSGPSGAFTNCGFTGGTNGRWFIGMNDTTQPMFLVNNSGQDVATNRILISGASQLVFTNRYATFFAMYETNAAAWVVVASTGQRDYSGNFTGSFIGDGSQLTNLPNIGAGVTWGLTGNAGTGPANFLGTLDTNVLRFVTHARLALSLDARGGAGPIDYCVYPFDASLNPNGNVISDGWNGASILGGYNNSNGGAVSSVAGGQLNSIPVGANYASVGGGYGNQVTGSYGTVPGGQANTAGQLGTAMGANASATNLNTFVWSDGTVFGSTANGQFLVHASGGVGINTNSLNGDKLFIAGGNVGISGKIDNYNGEASAFTGEGVPFITGAYATTVSSATTVNATVYTPSSGSGAVCEVSGVITVSIGGSGVITDTISWKDAGGATSLVPVSAQSTSSPTRYAIAPFIIEMEPATALTNSIVTTSTAACEVYLFATRLR